MSCRIKGIALQFRNNDIIKRLFLAQVDDTPRFELKQLQVNKLLSC
jgi:hypothetical protein